VIDDAFLALLACPRCKGPLEREPGGDGLVCPRCRLVFPVRDRLPVLLLEEAQPADGDSTA
jgi:uncharacterized protein YbaR (Trm112 family)